MPSKETYKIFNIHAKGIIFNRSAWRLISASKRVFTPCSISICFPKFEIFSCFICRFCDRLHSSICIDLRIAGWFVTTASVFYQLSLFLNINPEVGLVSKLAELVFDQDIAIAECYRID